MSSMIVNWMQPDFKIIYLPVTTNVDPTTLTQLILIRLIHANFSVLASESEKGISMTDSES